MACAAASLNSRQWAALRQPPALSITTGTFMGNTRKLPLIRMTPDVIGAINEELAYQSTLQGSGRADAVDHRTAGQLVTLKVYTDEALVAWAKQPGDGPSLAAMRKVAAIASRALIQYGCPRRGDGHPLQYIFIGLDEADLNQHLDKIKALVERYYGAGYTAMADSFARDVILALMGQ